MVETRSQSANKNNDSAEPTTSGLHPGGSPPAAPQAADRQITQVDGSAPTSTSTPLLCGDLNSSGRSSGGRSARSSATMRARKFAAEAEILQLRIEHAERERVQEGQRERQLAERERQLTEREHERQRELARLKMAAEEKLLRAKLAATDASDRSYSSVSHMRTKSWVSDINKIRLDPPITMAEQSHPTVIPGQTRDALLRPDTLATPVPSLSKQWQPTAVLGQSQHPLRPAFKSNPDYLAPLDPSHSYAERPSDPIAQLAQAIGKLGDRPKTPELVHFSGDISQWMAFKMWYERTKNLFSPAENMSRLSNAVRGPAHQAVASLLWGSGDPDEVMRALEQSYARPELLIAREVAGLRSLKISSTEHLNSLANRLRNCVTSMKLLKQRDYLYSPELFQSVLVKLSEHTRCRFTDFAASHMPLDQSTPKLELLSQFLIEEADRQLKYNLALCETPLKWTPPTVKEATCSVVTSKPQPKCAFCKQGPHNVNVCKAFLQLDLEKRWQWTKEAKACYRCLKTSPHRWTFCRAKACGIRGCTRRHHALLHGVSDVAPTLSTVAADTSNLQPLPPIKSESLNVTGSQKAQSCSRPRGLLKILPVTVEGPNGEYETTALLDEGSTATLIDGDVAAYVGVKSERRERLHIEGVGGMSKDVVVSYVQFYIRGRNMSDRHLIENARAITPLGLQLQNTCPINLADFDHLSDLSSQLTLSDAAPTVLIGAPDWQLLLSHEMKVGGKNEPVATRTPLGWVLHGAISTACKPVEFVNNVMAANELETLIKEQYEIDALGITKKALKHNHDDQRAVDVIEASVRRLETGRFEVGLPWKAKLPEFMPDSYPQALSRLKSIERQMAKDSNFKAAYEAFIDGIISNGYAEECDRKTYHCPSGPERSAKVSSHLVWYLPTFGVVHPQKGKLRVVHDAAATTSGVSLNDLLLQGPDLLQPLLDILFRFREGQVAVNGDIKEMFPQIKIRPSDRDAQRFLWRSKDGEIKEFRMSSMIFGAVSSPFMALHLKNKNATDFREEFPEACRAIISDHYMDDYLASSPNCPEAAKLVSDIIKVHLGCCFEMRSWVSNTPAALALVPKELRSEFGKEVNLPPNNNIGVLGVKWNPSHDTLSFRTIPHEPNAKLTKRSFLFSVMKVYDPMGLLTPITIQGRIILQRLWRDGLDWDSPMPGKYISACEEWFHQLESASSVAIPRWYMTQSNPADLQLHLFADGGEQAYACVAYWRFINGDGTVSMALIGGKARVAPLKPISIPRLELQAALIATRFAQTILNAHRLSPSAVIYWTDSTTVLKWLRSDARSFKPFVAHRLGEILESTNPGDWKWLPSALNNADDATKPKVQKLTVSHRWFSGPSFLFDPSTEWPVEPVFDLEDTPALERKPELVGLLCDTITPLPIFLPNYPIPELTRFSRWLRLLRATARFLQAVRIFRSKISRPLNQNSYVYLQGTASPSELSASDLVRAELLLLLRVQVDSFPQELKHLQAAQPLPSSSKIVALTPVLDVADGLIKMDSRIKSAPGEGENFRTPIILDGHHHIVRLMILHYHCNAAHSFNELILNEIRQRFWIPRARSTIRSVVSTCVKCRKQKAQPKTPVMGDLPCERLDHHTRPFTHVGLDYFGPLTVTVLRRRVKRYVALYTCLVTRALHLEVVYSLSTDAALMSLRRFIARRGSPTTIFSDNGTNFVGASRELRTLHGVDVENFATNQKIQWRFIPPASPFMGGAWERLVRTVKTAMKACLTNETPNDEVLSTVLLEAEAIVNSRPLTYVSSSPEAPEAITPFHFLIGSSSVAPWTSSLTDADLTRRCDWRRTLRLADHFWARWLREYLPTLHRKGPRTRLANFSEGDVVLIGDPSLPRGLWPLGRVEKTYRGADGLVRVVDVVTKGGTLRRPVRKLVLLEAERLPVSTSI